MSGFGLRVDRVVGDELGNFFVVPALTPDVANLHQGTCLIDNPSELEPGLHRFIMQQAKQPMDRGNLFNHPTLVCLGQTRFNMP